MTYLKLNSELQEKSFKELIFNIFNENGHIFFWMDRSIREYAFDDWITSINDYDIYEISFGLTYKKSNLFLLKIDNIKVLERIISEIDEYLKASMRIDDNEYLIYGFGVLSEAIETLETKIKKSLKLLDHNHNFIFRWYDPRVAIYLTEIFDESVVNNYFSIFKQWYFTHPTGLYLYTKNKEKKRRLVKVNIQESMYLDLIEIANLLYFDLSKNMVVDHLEIFEGLKRAVTEYKLENYQDIYLFGHYSQVIGDDFLRHEICQKKQQNSEDFESVLESISNEEWIKIKEDLYRGMYGG